MSAFFSVNKITYSRFTNSGYYIEIEYEKKVCTAVLNFVEEKGDFRHDSLNNLGDI